MVMCVPDTPNIVLCKGPGGVIVSAAAKAENCQEPPPQVVPLRAVAIAVLSATRWSTDDPEIPGRSTTIPPTRKLPVPDEE